MIVKSYCSNYRDIDITISNLSLLSGNYESGMCTFHIQLNHRTLIKTFESAEYSEVLSTGTYAESYLLVHMLNPTLTSVKIRFLISLRKALPPLSLNLLFFRC